MSIAIRSLLIKGFVTSALIAMMACKDNAGQEIVIPGVTDETPTPIGQPAPSPSPVPDPSMLYKMEAITVLPLQGPMEWVMRDEKISYIDSDKKLVTRSVLQWDNPRTTIELKLPASPFMLLSDDFGLMNARVNGIPALVLDTEQSGTASLLIFSKKKGRIFSVEYPDNQMKNGFYVFEEDAPFHTLWAANKNKVVPLKLSNRIQALPTGGISGSGFIEGNPRSMSLNVVLENATVADANSPSGTRNTLLAFTRNADSRDLDFSVGHERCVVGGNSQTRGAFVEGNWVYVLTRNGGAAETPGICQLQSDPALDTLKAIEGLPVRSQAYFVAAKKGNSLWYAAAADGATHYWLHFSETGELREYSGVQTVLGRQFSIADGITYGMTVFDDGAVWVLVGGYYLDDPNRVTHYVVLQL